MTYRVYGDRIYSYAKHDRFPLLLQPLRMESRAEPGNVSDSWRARDAAAASKTMSRDVKLTMPYVTVSWLAVLSVLGDLKRGERISMGELRDKFNLIADRYAIGYMTAARIGGIAELMEKRGLVDVDRAGSGIGKNLIRSTPSGLALVENVRAMLE